MSVPIARSDGLRGIDAPHPTPDLRDQAETLLQTLLQAEGLPDRGVYRTGEVAQMLRLSPTTIRQLCELAEHPAVAHPDPRALESFKIGCHHRIVKAALVDWLMRNQTFQREG